MYATVLEPLKSHAPPTLIPSSSVPRDARLVVVIPALNEERTIADVVQRVPRQIDGASSVQVVVVDDGSTDLTATRARQFGAHVVSHQRTLGVGAAIQTGISQVWELGGDVMLNIDGDGQFQPEDIPRVVAAVLQDKADFTSASRFLDPQLVPRMPWIKKWGNRQLSRLVSRLTGVRFYDVSCGMRAYGPRALRSLKPVEAFTYTHEVFFYLASRNLRLLEVPIRVRGTRQFGESRVASSLLRYAHNTLKIIARTYRDYYPIRFFGAIAVCCLLAACLLFGYSLSLEPASGLARSAHWIGASFALFGGLACFCGLLGDMLARQRAQMEEILYHARAFTTSNRRRSLDSRRDDHLDERAQAPSVSPPQVWQETAP